jgi:hypothetical protein
MRIHPFGDEFVDFDLFFLRGVLRTADDLALGTVETDPGGALSAGELDLFGKLDVCGKLDETVIGGLGDEAGDRRQPLVELPEPRRLSLQVLERLFRWMISRPE